MNLDDNKNNKIILNICMFFGYFLFDILTTIIFYMTGIKSNLGKEIFLIVSNLVYIIFLLIVYRKELKEDASKFKLMYIIKYIPIYIIGILLMSYSNDFLSNITGTDISKNEELVRKFITTFPIYMSFSVVIYAPIVEEITFRKTFKNIFKNKYMFILLSGFIFGIVHMPLLNPTFNDVLMSIPYIIMGIDFAYIYYKTDNIFTTMSLHAIHNFILLVIQFIGG